MRILYIAYDGKFLCGWWDNKPLDPPQPGKKWSNPGPPQVYGEFSGKLKDVITKLIGAKILPPHMIIEREWSWQVVNEQWAKRGIEMLVTKPKSKTHLKQDPLFDLEFLGKMDHKGWSGMDE